MGNQFYQTHDEWYWEKYHEFAAECKTYKEAYEKTEEVFYERFGTHRFIDYASFKVGKHRKYGGKSDPHYL